MIEKARSSPRCAFRSTPKSGWTSDKERGVYPGLADIESPFNEGFTCHFGGFFESEEVERGRYEVGQLASASDARVCRHDQRHRVRRVRRVRADAVLLQHLLGVPVVGRDQADTLGALDCVHHLA